MAIELLYGRGVLAVKPPVGCEPTVIHKHAMPVLADPLGEVAKALARPVGVPPLAELARGKRSACILICDITRPVPNGLFLQPLIRQLLDAGVPCQGITVLVATGLHRPNEGDEMAELVGDPWVLETVKVANHFATVDEDHVLLGRTPTRGTVVLPAMKCGSTRPVAILRSASTRRRSSLTTVPRPLVRPRSTWSASHVAK